MRLLRAADALHCPGVGCEPGCYLCPFSLMRVTRRSVTGSKLAAASSVTGFRLGVAPSVSSCSRKDEDRSNDLARLPCCCLRKTLRTLILSPSTTKSMSPSSLSLSAFDPWRISAGSKSCSVAGGGVERKICDDKRGLGPGGSTAHAVVVPGVALLPAYLGRGVSPGLRESLHIEHAPGAVSGPPWVRRAVGPSVSYLWSMSAR